MIINQKTAMEPGMETVKIPIMWTKTICGSKARILYDANYGTIDASSVPNSIVKIIIKGNQIFLYSDKHFRKAGGTCLIFKRC